MEPSYNKSYVLAYSLKSGDSYHSGCTFRVQRCVVRLKFKDFRPRVPIHYVKPMGEFYSPIYAKSESKNSILKFTLISVENSERRCFWQLFSPNFARWPLAEQTAVREKLIATVGLKLKSGKRTASQESPLDRSDQQIGSIGGLGIRPFACRKRQDVSGKYSCLQKSCVLHSLTPIKLCRCKFT